MVGRVEQCYAHIAERALAACMSYRPLAAGSRTRVRGGQDAIDATPKAAHPLILTRLRAREDDVRPSVKGQGASVLLAAS